MVQKDYTGATVKKPFPGYGRKKFKGVIKKAEKIGGEIFYRVKYEDGDSEHMSVEDVEKYLAEDPHPPKARKTEKRAPQRGVSSGGDTMPDLEVVNVASGSQYQEALSNQQAIRIIDGQGIIRYSMPQSSSPAPRRSQAVACGSLLFVSCILKKELDEELAAALGSEGKDADFVATVYRSQAEECLGELWKLMQQSRCFKSNLISVDVKMKDIEEGFAPFTNVWNKWLGSAPNPCLDISESFLGTHDKLISVSAVVARGDQ